MDVENRRLQGVKNILLPKSFLMTGVFFGRPFASPFMNPLASTVSLSKTTILSLKKERSVGMHFQRFPGQAKLVTVMEGKIFDVVRRRSLMILQLLGNGRAFTLQRLQGSSFLSLWDLHMAFACSAMMLTCVYKVSTCL